MSAFAARCRQKEATVPEQVDNDRLISAFLEGELGSAEMHEFESRLVDDEAFADQVARWSLLHRQMFELLTESKLHALMERAVASSPSLPMEFRAELEAATAKRRDMSGRSGSSRDRRARRSRWWLAWSSIAATAAAVAALLWWNVPPAAQPESPPSQAIAAAPAAADDEQAPATVATLTQTDGCQWASWGASFDCGEQLVEGTRLILESGMAKVTFECGAEVVLQGPCDFVAQSKMVGYLVSGRITANVPRRAFSFAILSPEVDFVDMGTAFGVNVGDDGQTELHVFQGEVICSPPKNEVGNRKQLVHVPANKAVEFSNRQPGLNDIAMDERPFARHIALRRAPVELPTRVVPGSLALWLAADVAVATDDQNRVISWQDILFGDNVSAEDAIQVDHEARPVLVRDAVHGKPAVRFDGTSDYLLTTPLATTDDQTVVFVCQFSPSAYDRDRVWGGQILNYDGPPSRYLSDTLEPGVLQIGEPLLADEFKPTLLSAQVFAGFIGSVTVEAGRVDARQVGADEPVVVSYLYDYGNGRAVLSINGQPCGEARAFAPQGITSRKIIGRHAWMQNFFHGDLAEMMIYNKALSPEELADATAYLADKYAIELDAGDQSKPATD